MSLTFLQPSKFVPNLLLRLINDYLSFTTHLIHLGNIVLSLFKQKQILGKIIFMKVNDTIFYIKIFHKSFQQAKDS